MQAQALVAAFALLTTVVCLSVVSGQQFCGNVPPIFRNRNITCPARAVCADVFDSVRDWQNGTTCPERRVLNNCLCPGGTVCPVNNPAHRFYESNTHQSYTCEPACDFEWCENSNAPRTVQNRRRIDRPYPKTLRQEDPNFNFRNYYEIGCRCPRHHYPLTGTDRAVEVNVHRWDRADQIYKTLYVCSQADSQALADPCLS